jgi:hypothetical protein
VPVAREQVHISIKEHFQGLADAGLAVMLIRQVRITLKSAAMNWGGQKTKFFCSTAS